jgi:hypothetical protein
VSALASDRYGSLRGTTARQALIAKALIALR